MTVTPNKVKRTSMIMVGAAVAASSIVSVALPASAADEGAGQPAPGGYTVKAFSPVGTESAPDDITRMGDFVYVSFQNGVGPLGEASATGATASTIQQFSLDGKPGKSWQVTGKVDGLTADPEHHRLLLTENEDGNSSFSTLVPDAAKPLTTYTYSGLTHGGGTDAVSVIDGKILVSASAPADNSGPAAYSVVLEGSTAKLTGLFGDTATATAANGPQAGKKTTLALTDPDSNTQLPSAAPRFKNSFMLDAQADKQLIFASNPGNSKQSLQVLSVAQPLDDTVFASHSNQTLPGHGPEGQQGLLRHRSVQGRPGHLHGGTGCGPDILGKPGSEQRRLGSDQGTGCHSAQGIDVHRRCRGQAGFAGRRARQRVSHKEGPLVRASASQGLLF
ncbi:hypothetical protein [Arthrobacter sp. NA-172]|uniref:hypothetical protein n=1 Tax=Arthrobacter sp. NA-172 TaxID=3367524 RepID=UPI003754B8ED